MKQKFTQLFKLVQHKFSTRAAWFNLAIGLCLGMVLIGIFHTSVQAQSSKPVDLALSPPVTYLSLKPGSKANISVTIEQRGSLPLIVNPLLVDFESDGESGTPLLQGNSSFHYLTITLPEGPDKQSFLLNPGQPRKIVGVIDIPTDAPETEYHLTLLFKASANSDLVVSTGAEVSGMIGSNLIVLVSESSQDRGLLSIEQIKSAKFVDSFKPLSFQVLVKNSGHNATTASGSAQIIDWRKHTIREFPLYPDMILANTTRLLRTLTDPHANLSDPSNIDPKTLSSEFRYDPIFLFGPYTLSLSLQNNGQLADAGSSTLTQTVIALPISLFVLLGIGVVLALLYSLFKNFLMPQSS